jgi:phosphoesterase RecJ-like protein
MAMPLFAAIATDTGWFRFSSTTAYTYEVIAKLIAAGASPPQIYKSLYEQDTLGRVRLRGRILERFHTDLDGRLAHTFVRAVDFAETAAHPSDTEDAVNAGLGIAGVEVAVILVEQLTGGFKISFRSRSALDCNALAQQFGGGGHKAAAGAFVKEPFERAQSLVLNAVRTAMGSA